MWVTIAEMPNNWNMEPKEYTLSSQGGKTLNGGIKTPAYLNIFNQKLIPSKKNAETKMEQTEETAEHWLAQLVIHPMGEHLFLALLLYSVSIQIFVMYLHQTSPRRKKRSSFYLQAFPPSYRENNYECIRSCKSWRQELKEWSSPPLACFPFCL